MHCLLKEEAGCNGGLRIESRHSGRAEGAIRNPYSRWWLWIPGSRALLAPRNDSVYNSTLALKPPQNIRLPSNGMFLGSDIILARRLSFITFFTQRSRSARDL